MLHDRIRFVTANFYQLQGLRLVPVGMYLLFIAADAVGWMDWLPGKPVDGPDAAGNAWGLLAFAWAIFGALAATAYYRRQYGAVTQYGRGRRNAMLGVAIAWFVALAVVDVQTEWPVLLSALLVSVSLFVTVLVDGWLRTHYLAGAFAWLAVGLVPLVAPETPVALAYGGAGGLTLIVCGLGDHRLITGTVFETGNTLDASHPTIV